MFVGLSSCTRCLSAVDFIVSVNSLHVQAVTLMHCSLDQRTKETTFVHQIFGGYLRSQGRCF